MILILFSATWPQGVRRLAQSYMKNPLQVFVGSLDLAAVHSVTQKIYMVNEDEKTDLVSSIVCVYTKLTINYLGNVILIVLSLMYCRCTSSSKKWVLMIR